MIQAHDNQLVKDCYLRVKAPTEDRYGFLSKDDENVEFQKLLHHISNTKSRYCAEENEAYVLGKKFRHLLRLRIEFNSSTPLALAVKASNDILVRKIVGYLKEEVADVDGVPVIDMVDEIGNTALHVAAMKGEVKIIKILVKGGANLLAENQYKMLPLHLGVEADDVRTIDTLLDCVGRFYERYEKEITGEAPFWLKNGENRSSYPAIRAKSKADVEEIFQSTSIEATHDDIVKNAQKAEKKEIKIKQILKRGIRDCWEEYQVLWNDDKHKTTWHNRKVIEKLLGNDQSLLEDFDNQLDGVIRLYLNQPNRYGKSSFMAACEFGKVNIVRRLLSKASWAEDPDWIYKLMDTYRKSGVSALMYAVSSKNVELIIELVEKGADLTRKTDWGDTALLWAVQNKFRGCGDVVQLFIDAIHKTHIEDPSEVRRILKSSDGKEPSDKNNCLMRAAKAGKLENCKVLVKNSDSNEYSADIFKKASKYAFDSRFFEVAYYLNPSDTLFNLRIELRKRCEASVYVEFLSKGKGKEKQVEKNEIILVHESDLQEISYDSYDSTNNHSASAQTTHTYRDTLHNETYEVKRVENLSKSIVAQKAFDYYLDESENFGFILRICAIDELIFEIFLKTLSAAKIKNVSVFFTQVLPNLYAGIKEDTKNDHKILWRLLKLTSALDMSMSKHYQYEEYFQNERKQIENFVKKILNCRSLIDSPANLLIVLENSSRQSTYKQHICNKAMTFYDAVFRIAVDLDVVSLFGFTEMIQFVESIFQGNLMATATTIDFSALRHSLSKCFREQIKKDDYNNDEEEEEKISFLHRTKTMFGRLTERRTMEASQFPRYCPVILFMMECFSKVLFLGLISWVCVFQYGDTAKSEVSTRTETESYSTPEMGIITMFFGMILSEIGEYESNTMYYSQRGKGGREAPSFVESFYLNYSKNPWNFLDLCGLVCVGLWFQSHDTYSQAFQGRAYLAVAAIPMSLSLLRYAAIEKEMGNLVISMTKDLLSFLLVWLLSVFGFGIALKTMFQNDYVSAEANAESSFETVTNTVNGVSILIAPASEGAEYGLVGGFSTITSTVLSLIDATLGNYDFSVLDQNNPYFYAGVIIEIVFLILTLIILFNLLIAKMSSTYAAREESAIQDWEFSRADIARQFTLVGESSPLNMLPVPLNYITAVLYMPHNLIINYKMFGRSCYSFWPITDIHERNPDIKVLSLCGMISDIVLGITIAPIVASIEVIYDLYMLCSLVRHESFEFESLENVLTGFIWMCMYVLASPGFLFYYMFRHLRALGDPVHLEFHSANEDNLKIVYEEKERLHKAKQDINVDYFQGNIIRVDIASPIKFEELPTKVRVIASPFVAYTGNAAVVKEDKVKKIEGSDIDIYGRTISAISDSKVRIPLFPMNDGNLINELTIQITEQRATEHILASTTIQGEELRQWIGDGKYEGELELKRPGVVKSYNAENKCKYHPHPKATRYQRKEIKRLKEISRSTGQDCFQNETYKAVIALDFAWNNFADHLHNAVSNPNPKPYIPDVEKVDRRMPLSISKNEIPTEATEGGPSFPESRTQTQIRLASLVLDSGRKGRSNRSIVPIQSGRSGDFCNSNSMGFNRFNKDWIESKESAKLFTAEDKQSIFDLDGDEED